MKKTRGVKFVFDKIPSDLEKIVKNIILCQKDIAKYLNKRLKSGNIQIINNGKKIFENGVEFTDSEYVCKFDAIFKKYKLFHNKRKSFRRSIYHIVIENLLSYINRNKNNGGVPSFRKDTVRFKTSLISIDGNDLVFSIDPDNPILVKFKDLGCLKHKDKLPKNFGGNLVLSQGIFVAKVDIEYTNKYNPVDFLGTDFNKKNLTGFT